jgi:hypothetical protein
MGIRRFKYSSTEKQEKEKFTQHTITENCTYVIMKTVVSPARRNYSTYFLATYRIRKKNEDKLTTKRKSKLGNICCAQILPDEYSRLQQGSL